jgi:predicted dehydrogenase
MASKVTVAIVGAGLIGPRHADSVTRCPDASLAAFVDPSPQAEAVAQRFGVPLYKDIEELLASGTEPVAAIVCSPNSTHVSLSKRLLDAGVHVLVEKPVAIDVSSGEELVRHVKKSKKAALAGHHRRFNPYVVAAKKALSTKAIGTPIAVSGLWALRKPKTYYEEPTAWRSLSQGGGPILINLVHEIDILHYLLGPIIRVYAEQTVSQRVHEAEEGAAIVIRFESGVVGTFLLSDATPSAHSFEAGTGENPIIPQTGKDFYRIFGTEGTLSVGDMKVETYEAGKEGSWQDKIVEEMLPVSAEVPFDEQIKHLVRVVKGEEEPRCTIEDGLQAVIVADAVTRAMKTGQPVNIKLASKLLV